MNKGYVSYHECLIQELKDSQEAVAYLNAALEDEDERVFLLALKNVLESQDGSIAKLSKKTKLNRENLHRILSKKGNPNWKSIMAVIKAMNLQLAIRQPSKSGMKKTRKIGSKKPKAVNLVEPIAVSPIFARKKN